MIPDFSSHLVDFWFANFFILADLFSFWLQILAPFYDLVDEKRLRFLLSVSSSWITFSWIV
jgi:hypothetical protein